MVASDSRSETGSDEPKKQPEVRDRIADAARHLFASRGYDGTTLREIAASADVTKPMVYYYFGSKEGLYESLLEEAGKFFAAAFSEVEAAPSVHEALEALVQAHLHFAATGVEALRLFVQATMDPRPAGPGKAVLRRLEAVHEAVIDGIVRRGVESGELDASSPELCKLALAGAISVFDRLALQADPVPPDPSLPSRFVRLLLDGLGNPRKSP